MAGEKNPDLNFEVGYSLKEQKATFSISISNIFERAARKRFGFSASQWWTRRKAKQDAKFGLPESHATDPDGREQSIFIQRDEQISKIVAEASRLAQDASDWVTTHQPREPLESASLIQRIKGELMEKLGAYRRQLQETRDELADSMNAYTNFREENGLKRHAEVPLFFLKPFVILLALLLGETIANSFIFAGISPQGIIGGWVTAVMVSVINILMGLVFGLLIIRYAVIYDDWRRKALVGAGAVLVLLSVFFNLYVAHFREVAEAAILADEAGAIELSRAAAPQFSDAWPHFLQNPVNLGSVLGIALFVIGLCIFAYATYEGYKGFTDPYPGFGKVGKRFLVFRILRLRLEASARSTAYKALKYIDQRLNDASLLHTHFLEQIDTAESFAMRLSKASQSAEQKINNHAWTLISAYRSANKRKRLKMTRKAKRKPDSGLLDPGPEPEYFSYDPRNSEEWRSVAPETTELETQARRAKQLIENNLKALEAARNFVAEWRTQIDSVLEDALDKDDLTLNTAAVRLTNQKKESATVIEMPAQKA